MFSVRRNKCPCRRLAASILVCTASVGVLASCRDRVRDVSQGARAQPTAQPTPTGRLVFSRLGEGDINDREIGPFSTPDGYIVRWGYDCPPDSAGFELRDMNDN